MIDLKAIEERQKITEELHPIASGSLGRLLSTDIPALCQEVRELRLALLRYGDHEPSCEPMLCSSVIVACTCGWEKQKQRLENANG